MFIRTLRSPRALRAPTALLRAYATSTTSNQVPANDPVERDAKPNVSETNVLPTSSEGSFDKVLQEDVADAERMRSEQAPNYKGIWSRSQQPREIAMSGPRFEQSIIEDQVCLTISPGRKINIELFAYALRKG
jgi:NADH dehydrogenase (ubiquinone) Fe-S protein 6